MIPDTLGKAGNPGKKMYSPKRLVIRGKTPCHFTSNDKAFFLGAVRALPGTRKSSLPDGK